MSEPMAVEVVSPERVLYSGEATMVITRTYGGGEIAFQANHAPFLGALSENHTRVFQVDGVVRDIAVHGGFVEVSGNKVSILSDVAELADEIDIERARAAKDRAEEADPPRGRRQGGRRAWPPCAAPTPASAPPASPSPEPPELSASNARRRVLTQTERLCWSGVVDRGELLELLHTVAGVDQPDRAAARAHHEALRSSTTAVEADASQQLAVGHPGGGEEAVVAADEVVLGEHGVEVVPGGDHGRPFGVGLR